MDRIQSGVQDTVPEGRMLISVDAYLNFLIVQCRIGRRKRLCEKQARSLKKFCQNTDLWL